ncbi:hypothetical protein ACI65C_004937 [Semiaphis heraclei]
MEFSVVEFDDGIHLVSSCWVDTTKLNCYWPHVKKESVLQKMMVSHIVPKQNDPLWSLYPIKRVMSRSATYEEGMYKLKLAEKYSDIDSSNETTTKIKRHKRQSHAKKQLVYESNDDEHDNEMIRRNNQVTERPSSNEAAADNEATISKYPSFPTVDDEIMQSLLEYNTDSPMPVELFDDTNIILAPTTVHQLKRNYDDTYKNYSTPINSTNRIDTKDAVGNKELNSKEVYKVISKLSTKIELMRDEIFELKQLIIGLTNKNNLSRISGIEEVNHVFVGPFEEDLPINTEERLKEIENKLLTDNSYFMLMLEDLKKLGGLNLQNIIINALAYTMSNTLASQYSWQGKRSKHAFEKDLPNFFKVILALSRYKNPNITNKEVAQVVIKWLVQAPLRASREQE